MYNNKLVVAIKHRGKILREIGEEVYLPFGSEYSIYIKNLHSVRVLVSVEIDGDDVGDGTKFIIHPNSFIDLERFVRNGNLKKGNRFKFIERTSAVEQHRGVGAEDGLIRVEFQFEKKYEPFHWNNGVVNSTTTWTTTGGGGTYTCSSPVIGSTARGVDSPNGNVDTVFTNYAASDIGVTAPGSISDQQFFEGEWFPVELGSHSIVLRLLGETADNVQVRKPVTVKAKAVCSSCGRRNKATAKFCAECGTSLQLV